MFKLFLILILIIIIFYILNNFFFKKNIKEQYLTYFLPFYDNKNSDLSVFYNNNENNLNYFKKKFDYNVLKVGSNKAEQYFIKSLIKYFISTSNVINSNIIYYEDKIQAIDDLNDNKINFLTTEYTTINYYMNKLNKNIEKLRLITTLFREYIYIFTNKTYNIFSITDIPPNCIIGIKKGTDALFIYYNTFLKNLGLEENVDYKVIIYDGMESLFDAFYQKICHVIMLCDIFPNNTIIKILNNSLNSDIILLPFEIPNEKLFLKKQPIINIDYIDLNYLSNLYLPRKFGKYEYTKFRPTIKIPYIYKILLKNIYTDINCTYEFIKFYYENYKNLNNNIDEKGFKIYNILINNNKTIFLEYHKGVMNFFIEKGYITNNNNENCKYLVGTTKCTDKSLKENNLYYDLLVGE